MTVWIVKDLGTVTGVYSTKAIAMSHNSWSEEEVEEMEVVENPEYDDIPSTEIIKWSREHKIAWINNWFNFPGRAGRMHPHDIWLGGDDEGQMEKWDNGTISDEELDRVIREGDWEVDPS